MFIRQHNPLNMSKEEDSLSSGIISPGSTMPK